jgi:hypothetical protein
LDDVISIYPSLFYSIGEKEFLVQQLIDIKNEKDDFIMLDKEDDPY